MEYTPAQLEAIKQQKVNRFKQMGLPSNAGQIADMPVENMSEQRMYIPPKNEQAIITEVNNTPQVNSIMDIVDDTNVSRKILEQLEEERNLRQATMYNAPRDKYNALESIKRGAKKKDFSAFIKAENGHQNSELPINRNSTQNRTPTQNKNSKNSVKLENFNAPKIAGAESLENLFTGKQSNVSIKPYGAKNEGFIETDKDYSNIGPSYDPVSYLRNKTDEKGINLNFDKKNKPNQVFDIQSNTQMENMMTMMESFMKNQQKAPLYDFAVQKEMMEDIAKRIAMDVIKKVLKEYVETQKNKNVFKVINQKQNIVEIAGRYYKLNPVKISN